MKMDKMINYLINKEDTGNIMDKDIHGKEDNVHIEKNQY